MLRTWVGAMVLMVGAADAVAQEDAAVALPVPEGAPASAPAPNLPDPLAVETFDALLYVRTADLVNVRSGPSAMTVLIGQVKRGDAVTVTGRTSVAPIWYQVVTADGGTGFVLAIYLGPPVAPGPALAPPATKDVRAPQPGTPAPR